ncbi:hypothetical protein HBB16_09620 [Pseudonocardia sp. MCCB 268]|nr:hypothetical protein [Pseudonocardia cytotoxica]
MIVAVLSRASDRRGRRTVRAVVVGTRSSSGSPGRSPTTGSARLTPSRPSRCNRVVPTAQSRRFWCVLPRSACCTDCPARRWWRLFGIVGNLAPTTTFASFRAALT